MMIWVDGKVVPDHELKISALDRAFEHGLGLFETFRTFDGRAPLLGRHLDRMRRSSDELGLAMSSSPIPDQSAIEALVERESIGRDVMIRLTLTGGVCDQGTATLFMRALPLPAPIRQGGAVVGVGTWHVRRDDAMAHHKSLNYWARRRAFEQARAMGFDEVVMTECCGEAFESANVWEGSRTNVFLVKEEILMTPGLNGPIVPGIMRDLVLDQAKTLGMAVRDEGPIGWPAVRDAAEVFLTNSVRGIVPVSRLVRTDEDERRRLDAPGIWTKRLGIKVADTLNFQRTSE